MDIEKNGVDSPYQRHGYNSKEKDDNARVETTALHPNTGIVNENRGDLKRQMKGESPQDARNSVDHANISPAHSDD
jgi:hypothetical protein